MPIVRLGVKLTAARLRRVAVFFCLLLLLCAGAGLLGGHLLYADQAIDLIRIAIVDQDDTMETRLFYNFLTGMTEYADLLAFERLDEGAAQTLLDEGAVAAVLTIPPGFSENVLVGESESFTITLNSATPLKTTMISLFVDAYTDMLRTGQVGVFSALDIAREVGGREAYDEMYRAANLRFLTAMLNRGGLMRTEFLSATGATDVAAYYAAAAYVFVCFLGSVLFLDQYRQMTARPVLLRLSANGRGALRCTAELLLSAAVPFALVALCCAAGLAVVSGRMETAIAIAPLLPGLALSALCAGGFCVGVSLLFRSELAGSAFATLASLLCLFLSGGVLPVAYFSAPLQALSRLTPNYWLHRLLIGTGAGGMDGAALLGSVVFAAVLFALCWAGVQRRGKAGARA